MGWGVHDYPGPPPEGPVPHCPVCGEWCDRIYRNGAGEIVGCDVCLEDLDAWDRPECFPGKE